MEAEVEEEVASAVTGVDGVVEEAGSETEVDVVEAEVGTRSVEVLRD